MICCGTKINLSQPNQNTSFFEDGNADVYTNVFNSNASMQHFDQSNYQEHKIFFSQDQSKN